MTSTGRIPSGASSSGTSGVVTFGSHSGGSSGSAFFQAAKEKEAAGSALAYYRTNLDILARKYEEIDAIVQKERERSRNLENELGQYKTLFHSLSDKVAVSQSVINSVPKLRNDVQHLSAISSPVVDRSVLATRQMAEDVFQRVHQEFSTVVADVVKTCIKEQNSRIKESINLHLQKIEHKYKDRTDADRAIIMDVLGRCETLEARFNQLEDTFLQQSAALERLQNSAVKAYRREMQSAMESMRKQVADCIENNAAALKKVSSVEKAFQGQLHRAMDSLVSRVEARSAGMENSLKSAVSKIDSVDEDILDVRRRMFNAETMARHALNTASIVGANASSVSNQETPSGKDRAAIPLNTSHVSFAALEATVLRSRQEQLGEAISCIEREHSDLISRVNILTGEVDRIKEDQTVFKGLSNENHDRMKSKFKEYEAAFQSLKHTRDALDVLTKRCEAVLVHSSNKATKDVAELKEESSRHTTEIADLQSGLEIVLKSYMSKKMMVEVLHSRSPIPSVLLDGDEDEPRQTLTPIARCEVSTPTPVLSSPRMQSLRDNEAKATPIVSSVKSSFAISEVNPLEVASSKPSSRAEVSSRKELANDDTEEIFDHKPSGRAISGRAREAKYSSSPSVGAASKSASAASTAAYGTLLNSSEMEIDSSRGESVPARKDRQPDGAFDFDEDFVVTAVSQIVRSPPRAFGASYDEEELRESFETEAKYRHTSEPDNSAEGASRQAARRRSAPAVSPSCAVTLQSVEEKRRLHRQRFQEEIRNG
jgi:uncharacterized coiled-coil protein SlyX